jgi:hypothetical protein
MTKESTLEKILREEVDQAGGMCIKLPANLYRGIPDRLVLLPRGRLFFLELKTDKGQTSRAQAAFRTFLQSLGYKSYIIQGKRALEGFLDEHVRTQF